MGIIDELKKRFNRKQQQGGPRAPLPETITRPPTAAKYTTVRTAPAPIRPQSAKELSPEEEMIRNIEERLPFLAENPAEVIQRQKAQQQYYPVTKTTTAGKYVTVKKTDLEKIKNSKEYIPVTRINKPPVVTTVVRDRAGGGAQLTTANNIAQIPSTRRTIIGISEEDKKKLEEYHKYFIEREKYYEDTLGFKAGLKKVSEKAPEPLKKVLVPALELSYDMLTLPAQQAKEEIKKHTGVNIPTSLKEALMRTDEALDKYALTPEGLLALEDVRKKMEQQGDIRLFDEYVYQYHTKGSLKEKLVRKAEKLLGRDLDFTPHESDTETIKKAFLRAPAELVGGSIDLITSIPFSARDIYYELKIPTYEKLSLEKVLQGGLDPEGAKWWAYPLEGFFAAAVPAAVLKAGSYAYLKSTANIKTYEQIADDFVKVFKKANNYDDFYKKLVRKYPRFKENPEQARALYNSLKQEYEQVGRIVKGNKAQARVLAERIKSKPELFFEFARTADPNTFIFVKDFSDYLKSQEEILAYAGKENIGMHATLYPGFKKMKPGESFTTEIIPEGLSGFRKQSAEGYFYTSLTRTPGGGEPQLYAGYLGVLSDGKQLDLKIRPGLYIPKPNVDEAYGLIIKSDLELYKLRSTNILAENTRAMIDPKHAGREFIGPPNLVKNHPYGLEKQGVFQALGEIAEDVVGIPTIMTKKGKVGRAVVNVRYTNKHEKIDRVLEALYNVPVVGKALFGDTMAIDIMEYTPRAPTKAEYLAGVIRVKTRGTGPLLDMDEFKKLSGLTDEEIEGLKYHRILGLTDEQRKQVEQFIKKRTGKEVSGDEALQFARKILGDEADKTIYEAATKKTVESKGVLDDIFGGGKKKGLSFISRREEMRAPSPAELRVGNVLAGVLKEIGRRTARETCPGESWEGTERILEEYGQEEESIFRRVFYEEGRSRTRGGRGEEGDYDSSYYIIRYIEEQPTRSRETPRGREYKEQTPESRLRPLPRERVMFETRILEYEPTPRPIPRRPTQTKTKTYKQDYEDYFREIYIPGRTYYPTKTPWKMKPAARKKKKKDHDNKLRAVLEGGIKERVVAVGDLERLLGFNDNDKKKRKKKKRSEGLLSQLLK